MAAGVRPDTALAATTGASIGEHDAIAVDRHMRTDVPDVYAPATASRPGTHCSTSPPTCPWAPPRTSRAAMAGANAAGHDTIYAGSLGSQAVKIFDRVIARTALRPHEAAQHGHDPRTIDITVDDHKAYYPGATDLRIRLTGAADGRLLGAPLLGHRHAEVAKRCDIIGAAIHQRLSVTDLLDLDLTYTPPAVGTLGPRPAGRPGVGDHPRVTPAPTPPVATGVAARRVCPTPVSRTPTPRGVQQQS